MHLPAGLGELTYCMNIHPGVTWPEVRASLTGPARAVKAALAPDAPFAIGLRFSAQVVEDLKDEAARRELKAILAAEGFRPITVNGFPYGAFHGVPVKAEVYQPDWRHEARLAYTCDLADLMAAIAPPGETVSLSTVPGSFRPLAADAADMADRYIRAAAHCHALRAQTGVTVAIAIEPEPHCFLETITETIAFFETHLFSDTAAARMAALTGLTRAEAAAALPRHLGLCYDVCHAAVEYEDPAASIEALRAAGIPVHKLQLSAALRVPRVTAEAREALAPFDEPTYLHQVVSRRGTTLTRHADLPQALALGAAEDGAEWRVHFHVPVFVADLGPLSTTQDFLAEILALHRAEPISAHLEVETYTFDVLPPALEAGTVDRAVTRELRWVLEQLTA